MSVLGPYAMFPSITVFVFIFSEQCNWGPSDIESGSQWLYPVLERSKQGMVIHVSLPLPKILHLAHYFKCWDYIKIRNRDPEYGFQIFHHTVHTGLSVLLNLLKKILIKRLFTFLTFKIKVKVGLFTLCNFITISKLQPIIWNIKVCLLPHWLTNIYLTSGYKIIRLKRSWMLRGTTFVCTLLINWSPSSL